MVIGFVGDVHGRVFHAIAALATWQQTRGEPFDLLIQVGDMGAYPDPDGMDANAKRHLAAAPAEADFSRLLRANGPRAEAIRGIRHHVGSPLHFLRGNHEDQAWLRQLPVDPSSRTARVDQFDVLRYVPDGSVLTFGDLRVGFLGGASDDAGDGAIDPHAHNSLMKLDPGTIDVLVTHDAPYGVSVGYHGQTQGSRLITTLVERLEPSSHIAGHLTLIGPQSHGTTNFLCLDSLVPSPFRNPGWHGLQPGCLALLDTATGVLQPVTESWLSSFDSPL